MSHEKVILECLHQIAVEAGSEMAIVPDQEVGKLPGFDSLRFVQLIVEIEEQTGLNLDNSLANIRRAKTVKDFIEAIEGQL